MNQKCKTKSSPFYHSSPSGIFMGYHCSIRNDGSYVSRSHNGADSFVCVPSSSTNICAINKSSWPGVRKDLWTKLFVCQRFITTIVKHDIAAKHARQIVEKDAVSANSLPMSEHISKLGESKATKFLHSVQRNKSGIRPKKKSLPLTLIV